MDWTFYVPKVRNYIVLYGDAYAEDDILPIENPARNPWHPGIYITRIPGIPKLDLACRRSLHRTGWNRPHNVEPRANLITGIFNYPDGNTNGGNLIGNIGRARWPHDPILAYLLVFAEKHLAISLLATTL